MRGPLRLPVAEACAEGPEKETGIGDQNFLGGLVWGHLGEKIWGLSED